MSAFSRIVPPTSIKPPKPRGALKPTFRLQTPPKPKLVSIASESKCKYIVQFDDRLTIKQETMDLIAERIQRGLDGGFVSLPSHCSLIIIKENGDVVRV